MRIWGKDRFRSEEAGNFSRARHNLAYGQQRRVGIRHQPMPGRAGCTLEPKAEKRKKKRSQIGTQLNSVHITGLIN